MKKIFIALGFSCIFAISLSLCFECLLHLLGAATALSLDGSVIAQYPRFIPFCTMAGILALAVIIVALLLNVAAFDKLSLGKALWWLEIITALVASIPMIKLWEMLFDLLQKTF